MENKVWEYRNKMGMSLKDLSRKTGLSIPEINKIENGITKDIMLSNAVILSEVLCVDLYTLFCIK